MMNQIKVQLILKENCKDKKLATLFAKQFQSGLHTYELESLSECGAVLNGSCELNELAQIKRELDSFMFWCQLTSYIDAEVILNIVNEDESQCLSSQSDNEKYFNQLIQCGLSFFNGSQDIEYLEEMYETCGIDEKEATLPILYESVEQIYDRVIFIKDANILHKSNGKQVLCIRVPYMEQNEDNAYILTDGDVHAILVKGNNVYVLEDNNEGVKSLLDNIDVLTIYEESYIKNSFDAKVCVVACTSYLLLKLFCLHLVELKQSQGILYS